MTRLSEQDAEVADIIADERKRQEDTIRLIASENYTSEAVMEATGSVLTNKYSEGYPGRRYYQGQDNTDRIEQLAIDRAKKLFGADHANVQPYSGSPANLAAYNALLEPGDKILSMGLPFGGHLTHGWHVSVTGTYYESHHYEVDKETERIDLDAVREKAKNVEPDLIVCGSSAYPRQIDFEGFADIADEIGVPLIADIAHISGLVASGAHPSPVPHADVVTSTTHKTLRGPRSGMILCRDEYAKAIDKSVFPGVQGGPHMHTIAAMAVAFDEADQPEFEAYGRQVVENAKALGEAFQQKGYRLVTGGTDKHLILLDVFDQGIGGKDASTALAKAGIICNANTIPFDTRSPFDPSGLRLGTPCLTTRGMDESDMSRVADWVDRALQNRDSDETLAEIRRQVRDYLAEFPIPG